MTDEEFIKKIGENINSIRKSKKLSQQELAFRCNIEKSNLIRIEMGRTNPTSLTLKNISESLNVEVKELFNFD